MSTSKRNLATFLLVLGAVIFGMVLAGGLQLTVPGAADQEDSNLSATKMASQHLTSLPSFADLAEAVEPAVVSIQAATIEKAPAGGRRGGDPFEFFFGPRNRQQPRQPQQQPQDDGEDQPQQPDEFRSDAGGSGFVISPDGLIVTNNHVIEGATSVKVHLEDRDYTAEVKGTDKSTDIALLKINAGHPLRYLELGDSDALRVGDWVMVIGNPLNLDRTVTTGVVSAKGRSIGISDTSFENFIQTDAAINFGNSGGPLLNLKGQVVAIATAINYGASNIGFAVPSNTLKDVLPQLKEKGKVSRGYLGIGIRNLDYTQAQAWGLSNTDGALVQSVENGTPAADAGVQHGDVILSVDGRKIKTTRDLISYVSAKGPKATVSLEIFRDGKTVTKSVKLRERPGQNEQAQEKKPEGRPGIDWLGIQYQDLSGSLRQGHNIPDDVQGVIVTNVAPTSPLYDQFVRPGSIISEVNGHPVKGVDDFEKTVKSAKKGSYLRFYTLQFDQRGNRQPFFAVVQAP
ncbi:MAG TPA: Do family serine endopeptidase [Thermoanaerobaculia bacterium]|nr:Do family serine endopeptidase [Thermoanaerobaculia bacterium]